ncbi:ABC transporter [Fadolivirus algeromassiliense]|jgi:ATP-binding cassette subfamily F protein 1|uniref:ABC transporter n=1 Tax=Fadolivirus FV1/VV64 TaxID=3070911 RepID=A0A7D3UR18_9VIRU|nr:ABC transporter [Fadolivirus algeromassiliense]QKF94253.1 ABC transporter [Fadolivirus FV1/VV64]
MANQKDISLTNVSISVPRKTLIHNTDLKIAYGRKYGLIGRNGLGKSTLLKQLSERIIPIPNNIDMFYVTQELEFDKDKTIYQIVLDANRKRMKLLNRLNQLTQILEDDENDNMNEDIMDEYRKTSDKLKSIDYMKDESIIRKILFGLGFEHLDQDKKFSQFSGGWKMRVSIARGLYMKPTLLMLDEPTNHLDLNSVIWLTDYLVNTWKKTLIIVSHDTNFLNEICTDIIHLENKKLTYYKGNYYSFKRAYEQNIREMENEWNKIQKRVKEMQKKNIPKTEVMKFLEKNECFEPPKAYKVNIKFPLASEIKWPSLSLSNISFGYNDNTLFKDVDLSLFENEKITIVGKNGVGKSTLLQILMGTLKPIKGEVVKDSRVRIGFYNQHVSDVLPRDITPIDYLKTINGNLSDNDCRKALGSIGLPGETHLQLINTLSGGQKARVVLASLQIMNPHILLLDEPTNHLDIESIDSLISGINSFNGAVIMITHNINVIKETKSQIYELYDGTLNSIEFDEYYENVLDEINNNE